MFKDADRALLIDFGSGRVLNLLSPIGVTRVDAILHTIITATHARATRGQSRKAFRSTCPRTKSFRFREGHDFITRIALHCFGRR